MKLDKDFIVDFIYNSNAIEGICHSKEYISEIYDLYNTNKLAYNIKYFDSPIEVRNTLESISYIYLNRYEGEIPTMEDLLNLHQINSRGIQKLNDEGQIRRVDVQVGGRICPPFYVVENLLKEYFINWKDSWIYVYSSKDKIPDNLDFFNTPQLLRHIKFETIHPFSDGNGRVGRLLYLWDCLNSEFDKTFKMIRAGNRYNYYDAIEFFGNRISYKEKNNE